MVGGCLLAGLIGMHHLVLVSGTPEPMTAGSILAAANVQAPAPAPSPEPHGTDHRSSLLHLCLAVLAATAMLVIPLPLAWGRGAFDPASLQRPIHASSTPRAPPMTVSVRLALFCVLRT